MQNTLTATLSTTNAAEFAHAMPAPVVKNDTATPSQPSIKLSALRVPATVTVGTSSTSVSQNKLAVMEQARMSWETTELAASNKRLYSILKDAYSYYLVLKQDSSKEIRKSRADELDAFIAERKYTFMPSTHDMTRVVKCVFGVDRRRVSAYSIALREALRQDVAAIDLVAFIEQEGGVEQIRMGGTKPLSVSKRAAKAADQVLGTELGMLKFDPSMFAADADWADKQVVIVATYLPTGEFQANAVIRHDSAVNAALAAYYSQQQANLRKEAQAEREAEEAALAATKAAEKEKAKQAKLEQQKAAVAAEKTAEVQQAALAAQVSNLFEIQQG
ncbi:hypothetical protein ACHEXK_12775 [Limnohabitans sp. DCL3]|uniref:hypothetical protein n=1 Tax=Limnohabitans sp. DCL3 TaxID=3374103 RepID=UPI003A8B7D2F